MTFAFIIMGDFDPRQDRAAIHGGSAGSAGPALRKWLEENRDSKQS